jgi:hypothetical protein
MTTIDLVPDQLWNAIQPLLPPEPPKPKGGGPTPRPPRTESALHWRSSPPIGRSRQCPHSVVRGSLTAMLSAEPR